MKNGVPLKSVSLMLDGDRHSFGLNLCVLYGESINAALLLGARRLVINKVGGDAEELTMSLPRNPRLNLYRLRNGFFSETGS